MKSLVGISKKYTHIKKERSSNKIISHIKKARSATKIISHIKKARTYKKSAKNNQEDFTYKNSAVKIKSLRHKKHVSLKGTEYNRKLIT